jgi:hypothetical protein
MKGKKILFLIIMFTFALSIIPVDAKKTLSDSSADLIKTYEINPDKHIYGIPFGTPENEIKKILGEPNGFLQFSKNHKGIMFGRQHVFLFRDGRLSGVRISGGPIIDFILSKKITPNFKLDNARWLLSNGIAFGSDFKKVEKKFKGSLLKSGYNYYYMTNDAIVWLFFSYVIDNKNKDQAYQLQGIMIERDYNSKPIVE